MDDKKQHNAILEIFNAALALKPEQREAFLISACAGDAALRSEVLALISADKRSEGSLSGPLTIAAVSPTGEPSGSLSGRSFGQYQILELLGKGGMGEVYRARDTRLARDVAIKFVSQEVAADDNTLRRVEREARMLAALNHPNIATLFGLEYFGESRLLIMEMVPGKTLDELIASGAIPVERALPILRQIAQALMAAHERGVIHRDLKPANVKLSKDGRVKLLDFGLAKDVVAESNSDEAGRIASLTASGLIIGTPSYMSPEQACGDSLDNRTDIWAFGTLAFEMLSGQRPFEGASLVELLANVLHREPDWNRLPAGTPSSLRALLVKCLQKQAANRPRAITEVVADLSNPIVEAAQPASAEAITGETRPYFKTDTHAPDSAAALSDQPTQSLAVDAPRSRRKMLLPLILATASLIAVSAILFLFRFGKPALPDPSQPVTLAVLPLDVIAAPEEMGYLSVGMSDAIITRLSNIAQLRVRPTSAILRYKDQSFDIQEVGKALKSENVLSGTLQQVGAKLRVSVQLVRVADGASLWAQHYDLAQQDLLALQDSVAEKVTNALKIRATAAERERVYRRYTQNTQAYEYYLRGRAQLSYGDSARRAVDSFEHALEVDPNYALAHAGLAYASGLMYNTVAGDADREQWGQRAEREAQEALKIDPNLAEAHDALAAYYQVTEFKWDRTIEECRRALELNPALDRPHFALAGTYLHTGMLDLVEDEVRAGIELNPGGGLATFEQLAGVAALWSCRFKEAVPLLEQARNVTSRSALLEWNLANAYFYTGRGQQAEDLATSVRRGDEPDIRSQAALASFLAARRERTRAEELVKQVIARPSFEHHAMYSVGLAYAQLGRPVEAIRMLRQSRDTGFFCYPLFDCDPLLQPLAGDPEFKGFMEEFRRSWEVFRARYGGMPK